MKNDSINIDNEYINELNDKHQQMRKNIEENFSNKQPLPSGGAYNKLFEIGNDIVIRQVDQNKWFEKNIEAKNGTFNSIFVPSLLKECGEDTITTGYFNFNGEEMLYMEKAEGSLMEKFIKCHKLQGQNLPGTEQIKSILNNPNMSNDDIQTTLLTMILECFTTANFVSLDNHRFSIANVNQCNQGVLTKFLSADNMKIIARHLCKVFLFQMFDRKPENLLVKNGADGQKKFIETDFDDIKEITCLFADIQSDDNTKVLWQCYLNFIYGMYNAFISNTLSKAGKQEEWNKIFEDTIKEYTITEEKMENIIYDIAVKNKYFGLSKEDLINDIEIKLTSWKNMLDTTTKNNNDTWVETFKATMENTLETLQKFNRDRITEIVNQAREKQSQALSFKNKDNTPPNCHLQDYIPNWMKTCCGLCQGG